ncbi:elongation factor G [Seohaeicola saemankumensis]|nr:elongation factor G [Seohaeicola saemankumensis]MCA0871729.1 elongation factor G [Seohaeicola saemankumensis]
MRVFSVLGPTHSGKSTLIDALAGLDGRPTRFDVGGVVTLQSFDYIGEPWLAIDVDGGADTLAYAGPALAISDVAVVCVPPDPDAAVLAAPYLRLVEEAGVPCILFINRMDSADGRIRDIIAGLQGYCRHHITLRQVPIREGGQVVGAVDLISERAWKYQEGQHSVLIELPKAAEDREQEARAELLEELSDYDDHLLEQLIEDKQPPSEEIYELAAQVLQNHALIPAYLGSASHGNGVTRLMKALRHEAPGVEVAAERAGAGEGALALSGFADVKKHIGKLVVLRALGDGIKAHDQLGGATVGSLTALDAKTPLASLAAGEVGLAVKSDHLNPGQIYDAAGQTALPRWADSRPSAHRQIVMPAHERDDVRLSNALARMAEIDPGLSLSQDDATGHALLETQGPIHMRRLGEKLEADFSLEITTEPVQAEFRETISKPVDHRHRHRKQSGGAGQFADVVIRLTPLARGAGFEFDDVVKGGAVPKNYIPSVAAGAEDALQEGPNGHPVVDLKVTLTDGKHHAVDSSDYAFRTAGKTAVRDALTEAKPVVLQPVLKAEIHLPSDFVGDLVPTISGLQGQVLGFEANPDAAGWEIFNALLPAVARDELTRTLASATRGTGWACFSFDHYEELRGGKAGAKGTYAQA